jgi:tripartite-type tricarboxylate transporter receptor subunit TctC
MIGYVATHATNPGGETQAALRRGQGLHAHRDDRRHAQPAGRAPSVPVNTLREFVAYARANPGKIDYGTSGKGTLNHLLMEQFKRAPISQPVGALSQHRPGVHRPMGGQMQVIFPGLAAALPHVRSGAFKPLAVTGDKRHPLLPNVPTFKESGYEGFEGLTWYGIVGPAKLPEAITKKLNEEINKILADHRTCATSFNAEALDVMPMTPPQFGKYIADEIAHWTARRARQQDRSRIEFRKPKK